MAAAALKGGVLFSINISEQHAAAAGAGFPQGRLTWLDMMSQRSREAETKEADALWSVADRNRRAAVGATLRVTEGFKVEIHDVPRGMLDF